MILNSTAHTRLFGVEMLVRCERLEESDVENGEDDVVDSRRVFGGSREQRVGSHHVGLEAVSSQVQAEEPDATASLGPDPPSDVLFLFPTHQRV